MHHHDHDHHGIIIIAGWRAAGSCALRRGRGVDQLERGAVLELELEL